LNVAWLPPENVFLCVIELPKSSFEETFAMVELQLEKLSPMPVAQIVWTIHVLSRHGGSPRQNEAETGAKAEAATSAETKAEDLQTVVVVIAERSVVEEFLGKLEGRGYLADRLEVPMLDQLEATPATEDGLSRQSDPPRRSETETGRRVESRGREKTACRAEIGCRRMKAELTLPDFRRTLAVMASRKKQLSREEIHALRGNPWLRKNV
jgi:hypothetical protein